MDEHWETPPVNGSAAGPDKATVRARGLAARAALSDAARREASAIIVRRLLGMPQLAASRTVAGYAPTGREVDIEGFLTDRVARGFGVFLPFVDGEDLGISRIGDLTTDLAPGWRGVREPVRDRRRRPARADRIEAFVVPGAAFDSAGARVGYGGGHFDRLLARAGAGAHVVGVAFDVQLVDHVPADAHDVRMQWLVTERRTRRCRLPGSP